LPIKNFIFLDISSDSSDFEEEQKNAAKKFNTLVFLVGTRFIASGAGTIFPTGIFFSRFWGIIYIFFHVLRLGLAGERQA
jgi:hypothetical protein